MSKSEYIYTPTQEVVELENWKWIAYYNDGSVLQQFDPSDYTFHRFDEIDQNKLAVFEMVFTGDNELVVSSHAIHFLPKKMKLIHFYRHIVLNMRTPSETKIKVYCFGFERNIRGRVCKHLTYIFPDGKIITSIDSDFQVSTLFS